MDINDLIAVWNHANCKVVDIRRMTLRPGESIPSYYVPSRLFLMSIHGNATVNLGSQVHRLQRFTVLHVGKGTVLNIDAGSEGLDYYSIYYKVSMHPSLPLEIATLYEGAKSFDHSYSMTPDNSVALYRIVSEMFKEWGKQQPLARLHVRTLLHQFVYELFHQMSVQGVNTTKRDLAARIADIIHEHYTDNITLESLSESLNYSVPHLSSYFKIRTGLSPIDYLIKVRIEKAVALLLETDATLKEIAVGVGYQDPSYLGRLFKKYKGVSPISYRELHSRKNKLEDSPATNIESSIVALESFDYTDYIDNDYQYHFDQEGDSFMFKHSRPTLASVLLLSFILVLSACGTNGATENAASQQPKTKIVKTVNGEVEIPLHPKRIVAGEYLGSLIALGITPIGTSEHHIKNPYFQEYLKDVENIGDGNGNVEKILSLNPDLIIMDDFYPELNEQMSKIAPTVVIPYASLKTVHEEVGYFGELLSEEDKAKTWLADYDSRMANAKESVLKVVPADSTFSIIEWSENSLMAVGTDFGKGGQPIYNGLGFKPPADIAAEMADPGWASFSAEVLPKYAGDYIILTSDSKKLDELKADPIWGALPAVKNDHLFLWTSDRSGYWDPIAILSQTEELAAWLTSH
ncbi:AraC family transcriptional regulator [Paenibacillus odorifer]|uniref:AraC family transcriptional regulator n=1 Tax=Paenibacillus odorifer TaxID=189426 RepID=UPI00096C72AF|nr:ABC transporter substrate-binding protein [Paenibacillus odorifer]OMD62478.1 AraC family transcriptional regulator [Paenibacillus odorifer]OMD68808.1 AraC family transcriptional regulator [Paenibacillus odorifer]